MSNQPKRLDGIMDLDDSNNIIGYGHHSEARNGVFRGNTPKMHFTSIRGNQKITNSALHVNACILVGTAVIV